MEIPSELPRMGFGNRYEYGWHTRMLEGVVMSPIFMLEQYRAHLMHPRLIDKVNQVYTIPTLTPDNTALFTYEVLQHSGNTIEGYVFAWGVYSMFAVLDTIQSLISKRDIPNKIKLGLSVAASTGIVSAVELGLVSQRQPDLLDIPAGLLGALGFAGANYLIRKLNNLAYMQFLEKKNK